MSSNQPSVDNIERMMAVCPDYHGSPADLIADVIHWCEANGRDFEAELERARLYRCCDDDALSEGQREAIARVDGIMMIGRDE
jgi:hypothetical protein